MFDKWIEVFKAGKHIDAAGNERTWTEADLDTIVGNYNPANHEAPAVIGHPKDNSPAFAWVEGLKREGSVLLAKFKDVVPEFAEAVGKKLYKKRSIALYPDLSLRHIGFLGGMPPAVKGLADFAFNESDEFMEFMDWDTMDISKMFSNLREYFIEKEGLEKADQILPSYLIDSLKQSAAQPETKDCPKCGAEVPMYSNFCGCCGASMNQAPEDDPAPAPAFTEDQSQEPDPRDIELAETRKALADEKRKTMVIEFNAFIDELVQAGKIPPGMKPQAVEFMEVMSTDISFEFAEGEGSALDRFKSFLGSLPNRLPSGDFNKPDEDQGIRNENPQKIAAQALEYQEAERTKGRDISITEAVNHITKKEN